MTRLLLCAVVWLSGIPGLTRAIAGASPTPPNVVFILIDDLRHDTFGFMRHPFVETPHLDRLARDGMHFRQAFVTTSLCSPARASFLTGQYMHNHGVIDNQSQIPAGTVTFPQLLQQRGYRTAFIGKWHMGGASDAPRPGFEHWVSFRGQGTYFPDQQTFNVNGSQVPRQSYMTDELTEYAINWLGQQSPMRPFLLYLSHKGVHGLYDPAPRHLDRYKDKPWTEPATMANTPRNRIGQPMWVQDQRNSWHGVEHPYHGRAGQTIGQMYRHYCEMILSIDDSVGQIREALRAAGLAKDTLIIFTSDGGHLWGEHGLIDKRCAYEESMRIPLLISWPGRVRPESYSNRVVANIDIAPTLLDLAGVPVPQTMDGRSLRTELIESDQSRKASPENSDELLYEYYWEWSFPQTPTTFALRGPRYKLIQYHGIWDTDELYDLMDDPMETRNLIHEPEHQQRLAGMRKRLHQRLSDSGGLKIPFGFKRGTGANQRNPEGSRRAEFPDDQ